MDKLSVWYRDQLNGWMSGAIFEELFHEVFAPLVEQFFKESYSNFEQRVFAPKQHTSNAFLTQCHSVMPPHSPTSFDLKKRYSRKLLSSLLAAGDDDQSFTQR